MSVRLVESNSVLELARCVACRGNGFKATSNQLSDPPCFDCGGMGVVTTLKCSCGRPVIWRVGNYASCNSIDCYRDAEKANTLEEAAFKSTIQKTLMKTSLKKGKKK